MGKGQQDTRCHTYFKLNVFPHVMYIFMYILLFYLHSTYYIQRPSTAYVLFTMNILLSSTSIFIVIGLLMNNIHVIHVKC